MVTCETHDRNMAGIDEVQLRAEDEGEFEDIEDGNSLETIVYIDQFEGFTAFSTCR